MGGFFWTVFAFFLVIQSTAKSLKTKGEEEYTVHSTRTHNHGSALQKDIGRRQKQLTKTLQHFLDEYKNLYKMAEDLKNEGDPEDEFPGIPRNEEHQSVDMNKDSTPHKEHSPPSTPEHDEHDHQRTSRSSPHNEHHDQANNYAYSTHAQNEHHGQNVHHDAILTPAHNKHLSKQHQVPRDTETDMNKHEHIVTRRGNAEEINEEDHVRSKDSADEHDRDEELGHSGEGEHSGGHEGETEKAVHLKHDEKHKKKEEAKEIQHVEKEMHKTSNHGDSHGVKREIEEMHKIEQMEKEVQKRGNHGDRHAEETHEEDHVMRSEELDGEDNGDEELGHSGEGEHSGVHEGETEKGVHLKHDENHKRKKEAKEIKHREKEAHETSHRGERHGEKKEMEEMHEIEQIEKAAHKKGNHGDSHRGKKETEEMHEIEQMEKKAHKKGNHGDSHRGKKETEVMNEIEQMEKEAHKESKNGQGDRRAHASDIHRNNHSREDELEKVREKDKIEHVIHLTANTTHSKEDRDHLEHRGEEVEMEGNIDHGTDRDLYYDGYHKGYEDGYVEARYHMDTSHDDDGDDSQGHGDVDSYANERKRRVSRDQVDDDLHHKTDGHQDFSHERKKHHMATRDDDLHHVPMAHTDRNHGETHSDNDDLHHGTDGNQDLSHERKMHHMATRDDDLHHIPVAHKKREHRNTHSDDDDLHHGTDGHHGSSHKKKKRLHHVNSDDDERVHRSSHGRVDSSAGHADPSRHERKSRHALGDASIGDVHHRHSQGHEKEIPYSLNDDTHHENAGIDSHQQNMHDHHIDATNDDEEHVGYHQQQESHGASDNKITKHVTSNQQRHHLDKERKDTHNPHQHRRTRRESPSFDDDIFIDESKDGKKDLYTAIFTGDEEMRHDGGGASAFKLISRKNRGKQSIKNHFELEEQSWMQQNSRNELDCGTLADQTFVYDKDNCRLCQCIKGRAHCEIKPRSCRNDKLDNMCSFINGEMVLESTAHYDGCNHCVCRKREWVCTRLRCRGAQHDYVNYAALMERTSGIERHIDICMECDREPVTPVCGPDWRTYRSLCHARFCGNYDIDEIIQGTCNRANPCENAECAADEMCVPFPRGPCLSTKTRGGHPVVVCKQYKCVSTKAECSDDTLPSEVVCGEDGQTYPSECHLVKKSVAFAYRGPCRASCMTGNTQVCGTDGVLYQSDCHANLLSRHVDYPGTCESTAAKPEVVNADDGSVVYVNRRCRKVHENKRCSHPTCSITVIPEGSCCPVCGAAVSIRVDRDIASDLLDLPLLKPSVDFTSLENIQSFIRRIQDPQHLRKCRMTIDYTERNDLSVLFTPRQPGYIIFCQKAAQDTMDYINSHSNSSDPIENMLAAAVAAEAGVPPGAEPKRVKRNVNLDLVRIRRVGDDHEVHQGHNGTGAAVTPPHGMVFGVGAYISLYWFIPT